MPHNLIKQYNELLDFTGLNPNQIKDSLRKVFVRDVVDNQLVFNGKPIEPTPQNGKVEVEILFKHLTTVIVDKSTRKREFDSHRSLRLHWVRFHTEETKPDSILKFSVDEPNGIRTYIYDKNEKYVIVLEPKSGDNEYYYLLTAYHLRGRDSKRDKLLKKYKRRLPELH